MTETSPFNALALRDMEEMRFTPETWIRMNSSDGRWRGDACGCPNPDCIGSAHEESESCPCVWQMVID